MMNFLELAQTRRSVRGFTKQPVSEADLQAVLEAGHWAPSACNRQPWYFIVVREERTRLALREAYDRDWFWQAPVIVVVCIEPGAAWKRSDGVNYAPVDGALAMDHITLCAADRGLSTCWIGAFDPAKLREVLGLPEQIEPLAMTPLGYAADRGRPKARKALADILRHEHW